MEWGERLGIWENEGRERGLPAIYRGEGSFNGESDLNIISLFLWL